MNAEELAEMQQLIRKAISDPGAILPRGDESVSSWSMRAVLAAIEAHPVLEIRPYYPTQDAYDATCRALEKHRQRADNAEAKGVVFALDRDDAKAEVERLTAALTAVDQDAKEARMERDEAKAELRNFKPGLMLSQNCRDGAHNGTGDQRCHQCECICHGRDAEVEQLQQQIELDAQYSGLLRDERDHLQSLIDGGNR